MRVRVAGTLAPDATKSNPKAASSRPRAGCRYLTRTCSARVALNTGEAINTRFLAALGEGASGLPDIDTLHSIVLPTVHDGQRAPGLRFGEPRVMALLASIASFEHVTTGLTNRGLRDHMDDLYDPAYTSRQATYDLRRLRLKGLIERVPGTHTYRVTGRGRAIATLFTRLATRVVVPVLTDLGDTPRPSRHAAHPLTAAWRAYDRELRQAIKDLGHPPQPDPGRRRRPPHPLPERHQPTPATP